MKTALLMAAALVVVSASGAAAQDHPDDAHRPAPHPPSAPHYPPPGAHPQPGPGAPPAEFHGAPPTRGAYAGPPAGAFHGGTGASGFRGGPPVGYAHFDGFRGQGVGPHAPARVFYQGRSFDSFRATPFYYPGGWGYRRWGVGQFLPGLFLTQAYFIGNWGAYGLGPPPSQDLQWVRYGPDALLVDVYTGQVVDTVYGVFWW